MTPADLTKECGEVGADAALVVTPNYYKRDMNDKALEKFFSMLADSVSIPVMLYNMPGNAGINIPSSLTVKLSGHPNIVGIKDSGGNIVQIAVPDYCAEIQEAWEKGDIDRARRMQLALLPLNAAVTSRFGIGGMKAAMDIAGYHGGVPRLPILPAGDETRAEIKRIYGELQAFIKQL